jgi:hypothetical protein
MAISSLSERGLYRNVVEKSKTVGSDVSYGKGDNLPHMFECFRSEINSSDTTEAYSYLSK